VAFFIGFPMAKMKKVEKKMLDSLLNEVNVHFNEAHGELNTRIMHPEQGFDEYDNLYRSYIDGKKWPFSSRVFIPLTFASIFGKGTRLITSKVKGKLHATQFGNELAARIGTEVLSAQYDDHDFYYEASMIQKWFRMDQNARKYGASFALVPWRKEVRDGKTLFDGPTFEPLDNRKVYTQPGCNSITDADYVIIEREMTLYEMEHVNDVSFKNTGKPVFMNLDKLKQHKETRSGNFGMYPSRNSTIRNLDQTSTGMGMFRRFRVLTEYRNDMWITFCPDVGNQDAKDGPLGTVLRVAENPYDHGQKPIERLVYMPIDDDIYGVSEIEPARSEQKAINALVSGFIEAVSTELYPILKGHPTNVDWKTIEFKPRAAWLMQNPATDIMRLEGGTTFTRNFVEAYQLLLQSHAQSMDDTSGQGSQLAQLGPGDKTATEIKDLALQRGSRDNLNKIFLGAAMQKMYSMWWSMDQQFLTDKKVIQIAGKEAMEYFTNEGLHDFTLSAEGFETIEEWMNENPGVDFATAYEALREAGTLEQYAQPLFPVGPQGSKVPKLQLNSDGKSGFLTAEAKDLTGQYRFEVDLNTIGQTNDQQEGQAVSAFMGNIKDFSQQLAEQGYKLKMKELLETAAEKAGIHNPDQFFEKIESNPMQQPGQQPGMPQMPGGDPNAMQPPNPMVQNLQGQPHMMPPLPPQMQGGQVSPQDLMGGAPLGR
jgi:hypothetical protein